MDFTFPDDIAPGVPDGVFPLAHAIASTSFLLVAVRVLMVAVSARLADVS